MSAKRKLVKSTVTYFLVKRKLVLKNQVASHIAVGKCPRYIIVHNDTVNRYILSFISKNILKKGVR